jgi:hypothetical protein
MNQVAQATDKTSVLRRINLLQLAIAAQFYPFLHQSVGRVAVTHASQLDDVLGVVSLTESDAAVVLMDLDAEVEAEKTEVAHLKGGIHLSLEDLHLCFFRAGDDEAVDIDTHQQNRVSPTSPANRRLVHALLEAHLLECAV